MAKETGVLRLKRLWDRECKDRVGERLAQFFKLPEVLADSSQDCQRCAFAIDDNLASAAPCGDIWNNASRCAATPQCPWIDLVRIIEGFAA